MNSYSRQSLPSLYLLLLILPVALIWEKVNAWIIGVPSHHRHHIVRGQSWTIAWTTLLSSLSASTTIEYQSNHGRGENHLSAFLEEGDVVVYQTGTWYVDGVEVGNGEPPNFQWARIDNLQVVWTHNCEHGVLRGIALKEMVTEEGGESILQLSVLEPMEAVEFGPEQLVARVSVVWEWDNEKQLDLAKMDAAIVNHATHSFWMNVTTTE
jgi:hypothetical protein